jgi:hypothetical protein
MLSKVMSAAALEAKLIFRGLASEEIDTLDHCLSKRLILFLDLLVFLVAISSAF